MSPSSRKFPHNSWIPLARIPPSSLSLPLSDRCLFGKFFHKGWRGFGLCLLSVGLGGGGNGGVEGLCWCLGSVWVLGGDSNAAVLSSLDSDGLYNSVQLLENSFFSILRFALSSLSLQSSNSSFRFPPQKSQKKILSG